MQRAAPASRRRSLGRPPPTSLSSALRLYAVNRTAARIVGAARVTAAQRCAVEVALVEIDGTLRRRTVGATLEAIDHLLRSGFRHAKDRADSGGAAADGGAVKHTFGVNQNRAGQIAVGNVQEVVERCEFTGRRDREENAGVLRAAPLGRTVERAPNGDQAVWVRAVRPVREAVKHGLLTMQAQLVDRAATLG